MNIQNHGFLSQYRHGCGYENDTVWEASVNNGKNCTPNIKSARDILEGKAGPIFHPKEGALQMLDIVIYVILAACSIHERQRV